MSNNGYGYGNVGIDLNGFLEVIPANLTLTNACERLWINKRDILAIKKPNEQQRYIVTTKVAYDGNTEFIIDNKERKRRFPCFKFDNF